MKVLVCYFSASGVTKKVAENIATVVNGDLFEIKPVYKYTDEDLDWNNSQSRSSLEMSDKSSRPQIEKSNINISNYDTVLIGFPIWWYTFPTIISTFIESMDFTGITLIPFCTSGGSSMEKSEADLRRAYPNYNWKSGKRLTGREDSNFINNWLNN